MFNKYKKLVFTMNNKQRQFDEFKLFIFDSILKLQCLKYFLVIPKYTCCNMKE